MKEVVKDDFSLPDSFWEYIYLKPNEKAPDFADFKHIGEIVGYLYDGNSYRPMLKDRKTHNYLLALAPISKV